MRKTGFNLEGIGREGLEEKEQIISKSWGEMDMKREEVLIKETPEGLLIILDDLQDFGTAKASLKERLKKEGYLQSGRSVTLDLGRRELGSKEKKGLEKLFRNLGLNLKRVTYRTIPEAKENVPVIEPASPNPPEKVEGNTFLAFAADISLPVSPESGEPPEEEKLPVLPDPPDGIQEQGEENSFAPRVMMDSNCLLVGHTLRAGSSVEFPGHVVILGDVNPGARVVADGHIIVMGVLRGVAHAGAHGNEKAMVTAFRLQPTQLRIAGHITRAPDGEPNDPSFPEVALIRDGMVVIEAFQANPDRRRKIS